MSAPRPYRQVARAAATQATKSRIVDAFADALWRDWMDAITLDAVASEAGTTRQTVIRLFGGKDGLLAAVATKISGEVMIRRALGGGEGAAAAARAVVKDYEASGAMILRLLAQEDRHPDLSALLQVGRREHRRWVEETFSEALDRRAPRDREVLLDQLVAITDVYVWKLWRLDMGRSPEAVAARMAGLVRSALQEGEQHHG